MPPGGWRCLALRSPEAKTLTPSTGEAAASGPLDRLQRRGGGTHPVTAGGWTRAPRAASPGARHGVKLAIPW